MSNRNLFTLFIVVIVVIVIAEYLANDYSSLKSEIPADVLNRTIDVRDLGFNLNPGDVGEDADFAVKGQEVVGEGEGDVDSTGSEGLAESEFVGTPNITFKMVSTAGFENISLQRYPFSGLLFGKIDLRDFKSVPVIQQRVLSNNRDVVADFYEFHADSSLLAGEIYLLVKERASAVIEAGVNETDSYGDKSYFVNYSDDADTAFLVVKGGNSVYALTYEKGLHNKVENVLKEISLS